MIVTFLSSAVIITKNISNFFLHPRWIFQQKEEKILFIWIATVIALMRNLLIYSVRRFMPVLKRDSLNTLWDATHKNYSHPHALCLFLSIWAVITSKHTFSSFNQGCETLETDNWVVFTLKKRIPSECMYICKWKNLSVIK